MEKVLVLLENYLKEKNDENWRAFLNSLFSFYYGRIFGYIKKSNRKKVEDLTQECFFKLSKVSPQTLLDLKTDSGDSILNLLNPTWENIKKINNVFSSYFHRSALNVVFDDARKKKIASSNLYENIPCNQSFLTDLINREKIEMALNVLTPRQKTAISLYMVGYQYDEIENMTKWKSGSARNLILRARRRISLLNL